MTTLVVIALAQFGFAYVVGHSFISRPLRDWFASLGVGRSHPPDGPFAHPRGWRRVPYYLVMLLECPACLGAWTGLAVGWYLTGTVQLTIASAFATSGSNYILARMTNLIPPAKE